MSSFKLGIFDYLGGYLSTALRDCGDSGVANCAGSDKMFQQYYLAKYYPKVSGVRDDDVSVQFTNAVMAFGKNLNKFDKSTSTGSIKDELLAEVMRQVNTLSFANLGELKNKFEVTEDNTKAQLKLTNIYLKDGKNTELKTALKDFVTNKLQIDTAAINAMKAQLDNLKVTNPLLAQSGDGVVAIDYNALSTNVIDLLTTDVTGQVKTMINTAFTSNYTTGSSDPSGKALLALTSNVSDEELELFNKFCEVYHKTGTDWTLVDKNNYNTIDASKLGDYRINLKMLATYTIKTPGIAPGGVIGQVPLIINYLPYVKNTTVHFETGKVVAKDPYGKNLLLDIFALAYKYPANLVTGLAGAGVNPGTLANVPLSLPIDLSRWIRQALNNITAPKIVADDCSKDDINEAIVKNGWQKLSDGSFQKVSENGDVLVFKKDSQELDNWVAVDNNCASSFVNTTNSGDCESYLKAVISGDVSLLVEYINSELPVKKHWR